MTDKQFSAIKEHINAICEIADTMPADSTFGLFCTFAEGEIGATCSKGSPLTIGAMCALASVKDQTVSEAFGLMEKMMKDDGIKKAIGMAQSISKSGKGPVN